MTDQVEWSGVDLAEQARRVRALARRLVCDPHEADDVAQQALVLRAERAAAGGAGPNGGDVVAWLGGVMRNLAARHRRGEGRRKARERAVARPEATQSTLDAVAHAEILRRVVQAVLDLDEPYRGTLLLRYLQDLPPVEVARRLGVAESTVRVRTMRGLERLRGHLRRELGPGAPALLLGFARGAPLVTSPLGAPSTGPSLTQETNRMGSQPLAGTPAKSMFSTGTAAGVVGAVVIAGAAVLWLTSNDPAGPVGIGLDDVTPARAHGVLTEAGGAAARPTARRPVATERATERGAVGATETLLSGVVLDPELRPVPAARVVVVRMAHGPFSLGEHAPVVEAQTGSDGVFRVPGGGERRQLLLVDAPGYAPWRGDLERAPSTTRVQLQAATELSGIVRDPSGKPIAGARVLPPTLWFDPAGEPAGEGVVRWRPAVVTDRDGRYRLRRVPVHEAFSLRIALPGTLPTAIRLRLDRGPQVRDLVVERKSIELRLASAAEGAAPLAGARVRSVGRPLDFGTSGPGGGLTLPITVLSGDLGSDVQLSDELAVELEGYSQTSVLLVAPFVAKVDSPVTVPLVPAMRARGRVIDAAGHPVANAAVRWTTPATRRLQINELGVGQSQTGNDVVRSDADGRFAIALPAPERGRWSSRPSLRASLPDGRAGEARLVVAENGELGGFEIRVAPLARVSGTVRLRDGTPPDVRVRILAMSGHRTRTTWADADGNWTFDDLPAGDCELRPLLQDDIPASATPARLDLNGGDRGGIELVITSEISRLRGRVVDACGRAMRGARLTLRRAAASSGRRGSENLMVRYPETPAAPAKNAAEPAAPTSERSEPAEPVAALDDVTGWSTETTAGGRFSIAVPAAGAEYELEVELADGGGLRRRVRADGGELQLVVPRLLPVFVDVGRGAASHGHRLRLRFEPSSGEARELPAAVVDGSVLLHLRQGTAGTLVVCREPADGKPDTKRIEVDLTGPRPRVEPARIRFGERQRTR